jgi:hypothetical protein
MRSRKLEGETGRSAAGSDVDEPIVCRQNLLRRDERLDDQPIDSRRQTVWRRRARSD